MRNKGLFTLIALLVVASMVLVGCGGGAAEPAPAPAPTTAPVVEEPTAAPVVEEPTATLEPVVEEPTATPEVAAVEATVEVTPNSHRRGTGRRRSRCVRRPSRGSGRCRARSHGQSQGRR